MAQPIGTHDSYDEAIGSHGNREDLSDILYDISPTETPVVTLAGKGKATAVNHEWLTDELEAAAANAHIEGDDATAADPAARTRLGNYTQIMTKTLSVSGTQEVVLKGGGVKSEMAYQTAQRMKAIKRDLEYAIVGVSNAKVAGSSTVAREMGSLDSYSKDNFMAASGSSTPTGDGTDVSNFSGTDRALTQTILDGALSQLWSESSSTDVNCIVGASDKEVISGFTNRSTRRTDSDDKTMVSAIDFYDGDFQFVRIQADRFLKANLLYIIDSEYLGLADLRALHTEKLGKTGDSDRKMLVWETTLVVRNPNAHVCLADLT
jgi:hypothetical protein